MSAPTASECRAQCEIQKSCRLFTFDSATANCRWFYPPLTEKKICGSEFFPLSLATEQARVREQKSGKTTVVGWDIFMMINITILPFFLPCSSVSPGGCNHRQLWQLHRPDRRGGGGAGVQWKRNQREVQDGEKDWWLSSSFQPQLSFPRWANGRRAWATQRAQSLRLWRTRSRGVWRRCCLGDALHNMWWIFFW